MVTAISNQEVCVKNEKTLVIDFDGFTQRAKEQMRNFKKKTATTQPFTQKSTAAAALGISHECGDVPHIILDEKSDRWGHWYAGH